MTAAKKIWKFLRSMQFAIGLLIALAIVCALASTVTQGQSFEWYASRYSERTAALILAVGLDDAYHAWWFLLLAAMLCGSLLLCSIVRLPALIRQTRGFGRMQRSAQASVEATGVTDPEAVFRRLHFSRIRRERLSDGAQALAAGKHAAGLWGAWICHLGILLLILGFGLGQMTQENYAVYGVPGQSKSIGDTGLALTIDDFRVELRDDDTVEQYTADITVREVLAGASARQAQTTISVNHPATLFGMKFYQNSTGWAARVKVSEGSEPLQDEVLCTGEYLPIRGREDLVVLFNAFYPDYVLDPELGPMTRTSELNNPGYLYSAYYQNRMLGMNVLLPGDALTIDEYTITFSEPQMYTMISVKRDRFTMLALLGGVITLLGLLLALTLQPARILAVQDTDGTWTVQAECRKGGALFREMFDAAVCACGAKGENEQ